MRIDADSVPVWQPPDPLSDAAARPVSVFISYSWSEALFVDDLWKRLAERGYRTWVDYRDLAPGGSWEQQLDDAIDSCDVALLVVSKRAVASEYVRAEWERARANGRPMILVIAEAAPLDPKLAGLPWVDLRSHYRTRVDELVQAIEQSRRTSARRGPLPPPTRLPPERGFSAPLRVWFAFATSLVVAAASLLAAWTLIIPAVLAPLPARILRRSFNYTDVRNSLIGLPVAVIVTGGVLFREAESTGLGAAMIQLSMVGCLTLFLLIRGGSFRRWAEPSAARPAQGRPVVESDAVQPNGVQYGVDAAPEDRGYATEVEQILATFGHRRVERSEASVLLRFVSQFHDVTDIDPTIRTIPIVVADADDEMPEQLRSTQWIDLRRGMGRRELETIGRHLGDTSAPFRSIGSPPPHEQRILPNGVQGLFVTLWIGIGTVIGYAFLVPVGLRGELSVIGAPALVWSGLLGVVIVATMLWLTRKLRLRRPGPLRASLIPLLAVGVFAVAVPIMNSYDEGDLTTESVTAIENANGAVAIPILLLLYFWVFKSGPVRRWIPARSDDSSKQGLDHTGTNT